MLTRAEARHVNETCVCTSLDRQVLGEAFAAQPEAEVFARLADTHPHLFADAPVYVSAGEMQQMLETVAAIEAAVSTPAHQARMRTRADAIAWQDHGPRGLFMGYDFHMAEAGPRLIEINTNAGGAFLNAIACDAQRACCAAMEGLGQIACPPDLSERIAEMFRAEWRTQRGGGEPGLVAIVDDSPETQYLYPEFLLARSLLTARGIPAVIADPGALQHRDGKLMLGERAVDLVYNRLVDFDLSAPGHAALRRAYAAGDVVVSPNPHLHAVFAQKCNLIALSDPQRWEALSEVDRRGLSRIPRTRPVTADCADALWAERDGLFFKPISGHGSKGVYRGDKLTRKAWAAIVQGDYVAQQRVAPSERIVISAGAATRHKLDIRLYTYAGNMLLAVARLYQGQTTNFRTPGGGFAPVVVL